MKRHQRFLLGLCGQVVGFRCCRRLLQGQPIVGRQGVHCVDPDRPQASIGDTQRDPGAVLVLPQARANELTGRGDLFLQLLGYQAAQDRVTRSGGQFGGRGGELRLVLRGHAENYALGVGKLRHCRAPVPHPMIRVLRARTPRFEPQRGSVAFSAPATIRSEPARSQAKVVTIVLLFVLMTRQT